MIKHTKIIVFYNLFYIILFKMWGFFSVFLTISFSPNMLKAYKLLSDAALLLHHLSCKLKLCYVRV